MQLRLLSALLLSAVMASMAASAFSAAADPRLLSKLNDEQTRIFRQWKEARNAFDQQHDGYWAAVNSRRTERRRKISAGERVTAGDFVMQMPPKYSGPPLRADIAKLMAEFAPPAPETEITTLPEMLAAAQNIYRFSPGVVAEREFKRRYAIEALAVGLTKEEVTRIYAFETGGRGTFDMQAGINPETKQGRAISTAMGYAQLLAANSVSELAQYGDGFLSRLGMLATKRDNAPERARELSAKIDSVRAMVRAARSVPREWSRHVELARAPQGFGIHVLNLDGDIGPWLQVIKLRGIKDTAVQAGRGQLSPAELELMNLAGPRTGLEMMEPVGRAAPTSNFFARAAYFRNTIVRDKTAAELLAAIEHRMNENMLRPGSVEFAAVFDEVQIKGRALVEEQRNRLMAASAAPAVANPPESQPGPVPPLPVRLYAPQAVVAPAPVPAERPGAMPSRPRLNWAPPHLNTRGEGPIGFPE